MSFRVFYAKIQDVNTRFLFLYKNNDGSHVMIFNFPRHINNEPGRI